MKENVNKSNNKKAEHAFLSISRVPTRTFEEFVELSRLFFANDYGMTLKWLVDKVRELESQQELQRLVIELQQRVYVLENPELLKSDEGEVIKTLGGKEVKIQ